MKERVRPVLTVTVNEEVLKELDRLSNKLGMNRSRLANNILCLGLEDVRLIEKVGLIDLANVARNFQARLTAKLQAA